MGQERSACRDLGRWGQRRMKWTEVDRTRRPIIAVWLVCQSAAGADGLPPSHPEQPKMLGYDWGPGTTATLTDCKTLTGRSTGLRVRSRVASTAGLAEAMPFFFPFPLPVPVLGDSLYVGGCWKTVWRKDWRPLRMPLTGTKDEGSRQNTRGGSNHVTQRSIEVGVTLCGG